MTPFSAEHALTSTEEIRDLFGYPSEVVSRKAIDRLDRNSIDFIGSSPFLLLSTSDSSGACDVSPRGDAPGFVLVLDEKHLVIPERPGNRRFDSLMNILSNPHIGLLFVIPGVEETLRVNGAACVTRDPALLDRMWAHGKTPVIGIGVQVEECFLHCAKAFKRSRLWEPGSWKDRDLPNAARILAGHVKDEQFPEAKIRELLNDSYTNRMY